MGTIPGGSNYAEHHPDGTSKQIDLRIGMLAFYREDTIVILLRGKTVSMSSEKDLSVDGMRTDLLGLMQMITF